MRNFTRASLKCHRLPWALNGQRDFVQQIHNFLIRTYSSYFELTPRISYFELSKFPLLAYLSNPMNYYLLFLKPI